MISGRGLWSVEVGTWKLVKSQHFAARKSVYFQVRLPHFKTDWMWTARRSLSQRNLGERLDMALMPSRPHPIEQAGKEYVMAGSKPDYSVSVSRKGSDDKNHYTTIGSGWKVAKDGISIQLDALPHDGKCVLFPRKDDE
jgi:hypothetical protein